ncbi:MAG: alkaline phosphatase family protein [Pseudomonadota bacterium]
MTRNRVLLVAIDGVDWAGFVAEAAARRLPRLAGLAAQGTALPLRPLPPFAGPASLATIATGRPPEQHGFLRHTESWAGGWRGAGRESWGAVPIWQTAADAGLATASVGWPGTAPGDGWAGCHVDDAALWIDGVDHDHWALPLGCAPADLREDLRDARVHPSEIEAAAIAPFLSAPDDTKATPVRFALAAAATTQAAARLALSRGWQLACVSISWLGDLRGFAGGERMLAAGWRFLDGMIGALIDQAGDAAVVVVSPGWRGRVGLMVSAGHGISPTQPMPSVAATIDVAPSLLALLGLRDPMLPGRCLVSHGAATQLVDIPPRPAATPEAIDTVALHRVLEHGFPPPPGTPAGWQAEGLALLGEALIGRDPAAAAALARAAVDTAPDNVAALRALAASAIARGEPADIAKIADRLDTLMPGDPWAALARGSSLARSGAADIAAPFLRAAESAVDVEVLLRLGAAWLIAERPRDAARLFERVLAVAPGSPAAEHGLALVAAAERDFVGAERGLRAVLSADPGHVEARRHLADLLAQLGRRGEAAALGVERAG